jgi:hypothetical protein
MPCLNDLYLQRGEGLPPLIQELWGSKRCLPPFTTQRYLRVNPSMSWWGKEPRPPYPPTSRWIITIDLLTLQVADVFGEPQIPPDLGHRLEQADPCREVNHELPQ